MLIRFLELESLRHKLFFVPFLLGTPNCDDKYVTYVHILKYDLCMRDPSFNNPLNLSL